MTHDVAQFVSSFVRVCVRIDIAAAPDTVQMLLHSLVMDARKLLMLMPLLEEVLLLLLLCSYHFTCFGSHLVRRGLSFPPFFLLTLSMVHSGQGYLLHAMMAAAYFRVAQREPPPLQACLRHQHLPRSILKKIEPFSLNFCTCVQRASQSIFAAICHVCRSQIAKLGE